MQGETEADKSEDNPTEGQDKGVRQSKRRNKRMTGRYKDYGLMMNARRYDLMMNVQWKVREGQHRAIIRNGLMLFLSEDLSDAASGRGRQIGVGTGRSACPLLHGGRNQEAPGKRQSRGDKKAHPDARHGRVPTCHKRIAEQGGESKGPCIACVPKGKER